MKRAAIIVCAVLLLAACGGGGGGGGNSAEDQIKAAYTDFFSGNGSLADHVALLENGTKFESVIDHARFVGASPGSVSATVSKVTLQGPNKAEVIFRVRFSAFTLNNRTGYAVLQGGNWKVASGTFCGLLATSGSVPSACNS